MPSPSRPGSRVPPQVSVPRALREALESQAAALASGVDPSTLPPDVARLAAQLLAAGPQVQAEIQRRRSGVFFDRYPDTGPLRRELYVDHLAFFRAGAVHHERIFLAANRIGKTEGAAYEVTCHMTGLYPPWWEGRRFPGPTNWWFAGDTMESTRNVQQQVLMGPHFQVPDKIWTGMIPAHLIHHTTRKAGSVANCLGSVYVKHVSGGISSGEFKSYDQGRIAFQGTAVNNWFDEEPPSVEESKDDLYSEILIRTMTIDGVVILTYTPLEGLTPFINRYVDTSVMWDHEAGAYRPSRDVLFPQGIDAGREKGLEQRPK